MPYANVNGINLYYEDHGPRSGPAVILTPGGRNDTNGLRPIAALLSATCRVILHDRRNCGKSDVVIGGELSEQHHWAEEMAELLLQLDAAPAYVVGGSAGSRTSLTLAVRRPEVVKSVFVWEVSGGPNSAAETAPNYYGQFIDAAQRGGMQAVAETEYFAQRIADNPANREKLLSQDPAEFIAVMSRWQEFYSRPNPVSELTEAQLAGIACPVVLFEGNTPDEVHHKSAAEAAHRLIPNSELRPSAWTHEEWDIIGQHGHTFPGIAATNRYHMKATFYAAQLLEFIARVEAINQLPWEQKGDERLVTRTQRWLGDVKPWEYVSHGISPTRSVKSVTGKKWRKYVVLRHPLRKDLEITLGTGEASIHAGVHIPRR